MKNRIILIALAGIFVFASCEKAEKQSVIEDIDGQPVLYAKLPQKSAAVAPSSKTALADDWSVSWIAGDRLTVFNAGAGESTYSDNCRFLLSGTPSAGKFVKDESESSKALIDGKDSYDWFVCCPWMQYGSKPGVTKGYTVAVTPQQVGYNSSNHIAGFDIMAGKALGVAAGTAPSVALHHLGTLLKFTITNKTGEAAAITGLKLDATAGGTYITGSFTLDWGDASHEPALDPSQMGSSKAYTSTLTVVKNTGTAESPSYVTTDETIANGESVDLYMVVAPFTIPAAGKIILTIYGSLGELELSKTMPAAISFEAGKYNTANLDYTKPEQSQEYVVFTETFAVNSVKTADIPSYQKAGLSTAVAAHKDDYTYSVNGNASIQASTAATYIASNYAACGVEPAYVRLPATTNDSFLAISNITVEANTGYTFEYNKVKGGGTSKTMFGWRQHGTSAWNYLNETTGEGTISQDFTTGEFTTIDIMVKSPSEGSHTPYTSVDYFRLIRK